MFNLVTSSGQVVNCTLTSPILLLVNIQLGKKKLRREDEEQSFL